MRKPPLQDVIVKNREISGRPTRPIRPAVEGSGDFSQVRQQQRPVFSNSPQESHNNPSASSYVHHRPSIEQKRERFSGARFSGSNTSRRWLVIALGAGAIVVLSSVLLSLLFAGATLTVHPKEDTVVVNAIFAAETSDSAQGVLPVERMVLEKTAERSVVALNEQEVEERASGKITIYNEYSETPQRIIPRTRFKSSSGLIYRVGEAVEIPGKNSNGTPGTIEVTVRAEEPGEAQNIGPDTFSVPGYEGFPQEGKIYAKSSGPFTGGFKGIRRTVDEAERSKIMKELETELRDQLVDAAFNSSDKPENYRLFKEGVFFEFEELPDQLKDADKVSIALKGKLHGILFPEKELAKRLAQLTLSAYNSAPIRIENIGELSVTVVPDEGSATTTNQPWNISTYKVTAQGKAHFIWEFDENKLAADFAGKEKDVLNTPFEGGILEGYPGIDRLEVSIRPFWKRSFPESADDIVVITELDG